MCFDIVYFKLLSHISQGLLKYTPEEHVDYANIIAAIEEIKKLNSHVDKKKKEEDNRKAIKEIKKTIGNLGVCISQFLSFSKKKYSTYSFLKQKKTFSLVVAQRVLLKEGSLDVILAGTKKKELKLYIYLFNDVLLITEPKGKTKQPAWGESRPKQVKLKEVIRFKMQCAILPSTGNNNNKHPFSRVHT